MNRYTVIDIVREANPLHASDNSLQEHLFVAIIKDAQQEQPFKVVIENFERVEDAKEQIDNWIKCREEEDAQRDAEEQKSAHTSEQLSTLDKLKKLY